MFIITLGLSISACSKRLENITKKSYLHIHPANKCIGAVKHAHANGKKKHQHYFHNCKEISAKSNAHFHRSPSSITGFIRHVHPNGVNKHTHSGVKS